MIPKIINYCWFGRNPIPTEYQRYIESWRKHLPDYEIKEWNEDNYDVNCIPFSKESYEVKKYAYVSDYARLRILYENGGVYFDTDVEVIQPMNDILQKGNYFAFEKNTNQPIAAINVNPGLGFACEPHHPIIKEIMKFYETHHYIYPDGHKEQIPIVPITTEVLKRHGLVESNKPVEIDGNITVYPWEYFCPMEYLSNKIEITKNTRTIHHYTATWMSWSDRLKMKKGYWTAKIKRLFSIEHPSKCNNKLGN